MRNTGTKPGGSSIQGLGIRSCAANDGTASTSGAHGERTIAPNPCSAAARAFGDSTSGTTASASAART